MNDLSCSYVALREAACMGGLLTFLACVAAWSLYQIILESRKS